MPRSTASFSILTVLLIWPGFAWAGWAPLTRVGPKAHLAKQSTLRADLDRIRFRLLPDRIEVVQTLRLSNTGKAGVFLLGLPEPKDRHRGPQDVSIRIAGSKEQKRLKTWRLRSFGWRPVHGWRVASIRAGQGGSVEIEASWWQVHAAGELHGYPRLLLADPLWTSAAYAGTIGKLERFIDLEGGLIYSNSRPEAEPAGGELGDVSSEKKDRLLARSDFEPESKQIFSFFYRQTRGAYSRCAEADPWLALDGQLDTVWRPARCPQGAVALEVPAYCRGLGSEAPDCDHDLSEDFWLGASVRTPDGKSRQAVVLEAYWGPSRRWAIKGQQNKIIKIARRDRITRLKLIYPKGVPESGTGDLSVARLDLSTSQAGADRLVMGKGWLKTNRRCRFSMDFSNPVPLRNVSMRLKRGTKMDAFMLSANCVDGRKRVPYHEPVACDHSKEELEEVRKALGVPDLTEVEHEHKHFKRKHPWQIELDLDPSCSVTKLSVIAPPLVCTDKYLPVLPRLELTY